MDQLGRVIEQLIDRLRSPVARDLPEGSSAVDGEHSTWIAWGCEGNQEPEEYKFATPEELLAFKTGVDAAQGWLDYEEFDTKAAADTWWAEQETEK